MVHDQKQYHMGIRVKFSLKKVILWQIKSPNCRGTYLWYPDNSDSVYCATYSALRSADLQRYPIVRVRIRWVVSTDSSRWTLDVQELANKTGAVIGYVLS